MGNIGKYIYGVINSNKDFHLYATNDSLDSELVYPIPYQDVSAVVSDSEIIDYTSMRKDMLARRLLKHQQVIERVMKLDHAIIPMKLGTFAIDEIEVKNILNRGFILINDIMAKVSERIEIDVAATWSDFNSVLRELSEQRGIKELKQIFLSKKAGVTVDEQMKIGLLVKKHLDRRREEFSSEIQKSLVRFAQDFKAHALMDDKMVINIAYLLDKTLKKDFEEKIEKLNNKFKELLNFRCIGPLPAYSFYTLEVKRMQFEEIDWARKNLGLLSDVTDRDEIKKAYQKFAFSTHPDKNPDIPDAGKNFDNVKKSYSILTDYCLSCAQAGQNEGCSFEKEDFRKNSILVRIKE